MLTPSEAADLVVQHFSPQRSAPLEEILIELLGSRGLGPFTAASLAAELLPRVVQRLSRMDDRLFPFDLDLGGTPWLIGRARNRPGEPTSESRVRQYLHLLTPLRQSVYECGDAAFERICARIMRLSGASEAFAIPGGDEGGIDIYGRVPVWKPNLPQGLLRLKLADRSLLFLGQCKCYSPGATVPRDEVQKFVQQASDCIGKYRGWNRKPGNHVPETYYREGETALLIYFTTGSFSSGAESPANAFDVITVDGIDIAQLLLSQQIGIKTETDPPTVSSESLINWAGELTAGGSSA